MLWKRGEDYMYGSIPTACTHTVGTHQHIVGLDKAVSLSLSCGRGADACDGFSLHP